MLKFKTKSSSTSDKQSKESKINTHNVENGAKTLTKPVKPTEKNSLASYYAKRIVGALALIVINSGLINGYYNEAYSIANAINSNNLSNAGLYFYLFMMIPIGIFLAMVTFGSIVWIIKFKWSSKYVPAYFAAQNAKYQRKLAKYNQRQTKNNN